MKGKANELYDILQKAGVTGASSTLMGQNSINMKQTKIHREDKGPASIKSAVPILKALEFSSFRFYLESNIPKSFYAKPKPINLMNN